MSSFTFSTDVSKGANEKHTWHTPHGLALWTIIAIAVVAVLFNPVFLGNVIGEGEPHALYLNMTYTEDASVNLDGNITYIALSGEFSGSSFNITATANGSTVVVYQYIATAAESTTLLTGFVTAVFNSSNSTLNASLNDTKSNASQINVSKVNESESRPRQPAYEIDPTPLTKEDFTKQTNATNSTAIANTPTHTFTFKCIDSCDIFMQNPVLSIQTDGNLTIDTIHYNTWIPYVPPTQFKDFPDFNTTGTLTLNLSDYFQGPNLTYDVVTYDAELTFNVTDNILTLYKNSTDETLLFIEAANQFDSITSNIFTIFSINTTNITFNASLNNLTLNTSLQNITINLTANATNITLNNTPQVVSLVEIGKPVLWKQVITKNTTEQVNITPDKDAFNITIKDASTKTILKEYRRWEKGSTNEENKGLIQSVSAQSITAQSVTAQSPSINASPTITIDDPIEELEIEFYTPALSSSRQILLQAKNKSPSPHHTTTLLFTPELT